LDDCGGHTDYHFHESLSCLYTTEDGSGHSEQVGEALDGKFLYGKWEDYSAGELPELDACGGHFGTNPDSGDEVYHYHVQDGPPFTIGCYGPNADGEEVTLEECRALYEGCSGDANTYATEQGDIDYMLWCPCFDENGSNVVSTSGMRVSVSSSSSSDSEPAPIPSAEHMERERAKYGCCKPGRRLFFGSVSRDCIPCE